MSGEAAGALPGPPVRNYRGRMVFIARLITYTALTVSGAAAVIAGQPPSLGVFGWVATLWSAFLAVGGLIALVGYLTHRWAIEKAGLPLLSSAIIMYGVALLSLSARDRPGVLAVGCLAIAAGMEFFARVVGVSHELKVIEHLTSTPATPNDAEGST